MHQFFYHTYAPRVYFSSLYSVFRIRASILQIDVIPNHLRPKQICVTLDLLEERQKEFSLCCKLFYRNANYSRFLP